MLFCVDAIQVRMKELRDDLQAREVTIQALKSKIAELYVEVQTTMQSKMEADSEARTARNDLVALVKAKEWYQEQLSTAHEVRAKLQRQLTQLQAQTVSQVQFFIS
jgi:chromosome segregation ATPase